METLTIAATKYQVIRRQAAADLCPGTFWARQLAQTGARGFVFLAKVRGTRLYRAIENSDGTIGQPYDTHTTVEGYGVR